MQIYAATTEFEEEEENGNNCKCRCGEAAGGGGGKADKLVIHEAYKIAEGDGATTDVVLKPVAELASHDRRLRFVAPKFVLRRRRNLNGKNFRVAVKWMHESNHEMQDLGNGYPTCPRSRSRERYIGGNGAGDEFYL